MSSSSPVHISGIRIAHIDGGEREVKTHRAVPTEGPIVWGKPVRSPEGKVRIGHGRSGMMYRVKQGGQWQVLVVAGRGRELEIGSARLQDHALALAGLWEQAVLSGRIDMD